MPTLIDSESLGDPAFHLSLGDLEQGLAALPSSPQDSGTVRLMVRRIEGGVREVVESAVLSADLGMPGDSWGRGADRTLEAQLTAMEFRVAEMIANEQPLTLFGDQILLDLDLGQSNLPAGSRLRLGSAVMEVTPMPHNGCRKYRARFGGDALRFISRGDMRPRNLRGIYLRVVTGGLVKVGDPAEVLLRAAPLDPKAPHPPSGGS